MGKYYIDVPKVLIDKGMSSNIYSSSAIGQGKSNTANVVGFIRITASKSGGGTGIQIGNFNAPVFQNTAKVWYSVNNDAAKSLSYILDASTGADYGGLIDSSNYNVANGWGVECPDPASTSGVYFASNDIYIFVGLKNTSNLN